MDIVVGFAKSDSQIWVKEINTNNQNINDAIIDREHINDTPLNLLISPEASWIEGFNLKNELGLYPILNDQTVGLSIDEFETIDGNALQELYFKQNHYWVLKNNMQTLEEIYPLISHLKNLWDKDRISFFEELWTFFKKNLGTNELTILFNDLEEVQNKDGGTTPKLIQSAIEGKKSYNIRQASIQEISLLDHFKGKFSDHFEIETLNLDKNELVGIVQIENSPIMIMAKIGSFNEIQRSLINAIFNGLSA